MPATVKVPPERTLTVDNGVWTSTDDPQMAEVFNRMIRDGSVEPGTYTPDPDRQWAEQFAEIFGGELVSSTTPEAPANEDRDGVPRVY